MLSIALVFLIGILGTIFTISSVHMINLGRDLPYCRFTRMNMDRNFEPICSVCVPGYILIDTLECIEFWLKYFFDGFSYYLLYISIMDHMAWSSIVENLMPLLVSSSTAIIVWKSNSSAIFLVTSFSFISYLVLFKIIPWRYSEFFLVSCGSSGLNSSIALRQRELYLLDIGGVISKCTIFFLIISDISCISVSAFAKLAFVSSSSFTFSYFTVSILNLIMLIEFIITLM